MRGTITTSFVLALASASTLTAQGVTRTRPVWTQDLVAQSIATAAQALAQARVSMSAVAPQLSAARVQLQSVQPALSAAQPSLASLAPALSAAQAALASLPETLHIYEDIPLLYPQQEDAETAWRQAREELNRDNFRRAATLFSRFIDRYPRSTNVGDAYYWEAFALSRLSGTDNLERAKELLETQKRRYARAGTRNQAEELLMRVQTELARGGDSDAAVNVTRAATAALEQQCPRGEDEDIRAAALNALMQMGPENALPVVKQIMARKDACSAPLRRKAVFIVTQLNTSEKEDILLNAVQSDPDREVRKQGVFWLSQVHSDRALTAIESILNNSQDAELQEGAIFALSQIRSPRAGQILRTWAQSENRPARLRENAIFQLGQQRDPQNGEFLRALYGKLPNGRAKEQVLFALTQRRGEGNEKWLMDIALNEQEPIEMRKKAVFHAGQMQGIAIQDFVALYDRTTNEQMKEQLIFVYSQRRETQAVDKLMDIARKESNVKLRKSAIFWLGQSKDPRVAKFLLDIVG